MTAPSYTFFDTPEYKQKLAKLSREDRRVFGSFLADDDEAEREMKNRLALMELGGQEKLANRSLALEERRQTEGLGLRREELASRTKLQEAEMGQRERLSGETNAAREAIARRRLAVEEGIARDQWDFERGQMPWAMGIGLANVAAGGLTGYASMKQDERNAEALKKLGLFY